MPPLDKDGNSPLWEAIGRRFMNMDYQDADILSRNNKEFIFSLFPSGIIYQTLLPVEARNSIGKVGEETKPVKKMLESIGFKYTMEVDPFDGGPHYRAKKSEILPIKNLMSGKIQYVSKHNEATKNILITIPIIDEFKAIFIESEVVENENGYIFKVKSDISRLLGSDSEERHAIIL